MAIHQGDISRAAAGLSNLSTDELKELCNATSNEKYDQLVNDSEKVKSLEQERQVLMASVRSLAEFNLAKQQDFESDRQQLFTLVEEANKLKDQIEEQGTKLLELSKRTSLESTLAVVLAASAQAEEDSESVAQGYLNKNIDYQQFVSEYAEKRKLAHLRRIKADRLRNETNESWTGIRTQSFGPLSR